MSESGVNEEINKLLDEVETELEEFTPEKVKEQYHEAQEGAKVQQEPPEQEQRSRKPQPQTRERGKNPRK